jgi:hypothetical protein
MKLVSLKRTSADRKKDEKRFNTASPASDDYSYGLCISLDKAALTKLGLKPSSFDVGDEITFEGKGIIKALRQDKSSSYDSSNVEIQVQSLGIEGGSAVDAMSRALEDDEDEE